MALITSSPRVAHVIAGSEGEIAIMKYAQTEQFKIDRLLLNILPPQIPTRLKNSSEAIADRRKRIHKNLLAKNDKKLIEQTF